MSNQQRRRSFFFFFFPSFQSFDWNFGTLKCQLLSGEKKNICELSVLVRTLEAEEDRPSGGEALTLGLARISEGEMAPEAVQMIRSLQLSQVL